MANTERQHAAHDEGNHHIAEPGSAASPTAGYIEEMVAEMEKLAAAEGLEALRFLLGRAREEAGRAAG